MGATFIVRGGHILEGFVLHRQSKMRKMQNSRIVYRIVLRLFRLPDLSLSHLNVTMERVGLFC